MSYFIGSFMSKWLNFCSLRLTNLVNTFDECKKSAAMSHA